MMVKIGFFSRKTQPSCDMLIKIVPDVIAAIGLALLGYGLYLFSPSVSFSVCGALLIVGGVLMGKGEK